LLCILLFAGMSQLCLQYKIIRSKIKTIQLYVFAQYSFRFGAMRGGAAGHSLPALLRSQAVAGCVPTPCRGLAQGRRGEAVPCGGTRQGVAAAKRWSGRDRKGYSCSNTRFFGGGLSISVGLCRRVLSDPVDDAVCKASKWSGKAAEAAPVAIDPALPVAGLHLIPFKSQEWVATGRSPLGLRGVKSLSHARKRVPFGLAQPDSFLQIVLIHILSTAIRPCARSRLRKGCRFESARVIPVIHSTNSKS
jgi:hypothetical protein